MLVIAVFVVVAVFVVQFSGIALTQSPLPRADVTCAMRRMTLETVARIEPTTAAGKWSAASAAALQLTQCDNITHIAPSQAFEPNTFADAAAPSIECDREYYVAVNGNDSADGAIQAPLQTIQ